MGDDFASSVLNRTSKDFEKELRKLIFPAMGVLEQGLLSSDPKLKLETAKWILSCFPETAPKKAEKEVEPGNKTTINVLNQFSLEKFKHIAEGVKKLEKATYTIVGSEGEKLLPVHREGDDEDGV